MLVPWEVSQELQKGGARGFAVAELEPATFFKKRPAPLDIPPFLTNTLDRGEAAVIQLALTERIATVCIDEASGQRVARLYGLSLTGTVGILIRAKREGYPFAVPQALAQMRKHGIWLSERMIRVALEQGH